MDKKGIPENSRDNLEKCPPGGYDVRYKKIYYMVLFSLVLEFFSPVPLFFSFGGLYVLLKKPAWFLKFVKQLYSLPD